MYDPKAVSRLGRSITSAVFKDQSAGSNFVSEIIHYDWLIRCLTLQGYITADPNNIGLYPVGELKVQLSIIDNVWSDLVGCQPIKVDFSTANEFMFIIPEQTAYAGMLRLVWTAGAGSSGTITVYQRMMPV